MRGGICEAVPDEDVLDQLEGLGEAALEERGDLEALCPGPLPGHQVQHAGQVPQLLHPDREF